MFVIVKGVGAMPVAGDEPEGFLFYASPAAVVLAQPLRISLHHAHCTPPTPP